MIKNIVLNYGRPSLNAEQYVERALSHVPLALRHHPVMCGYVVNLVDEAPAEAPVAGSISQLYFPSLQDYEERIYDSEDGARVIAEDVFGDNGFLVDVDVYATTEIVQHDSLAPADLGERWPGVKLIVPLRRRAELSHDEFARRWLEEHAPLAVQRAGGAVKYSTCLVDSHLRGDGETWDGFAELWYKDAADIAPALDDARALAESRARFIGRQQTYRVTEIVYKRP